MRSEIEEMPNAIDNLDKQWFDAVLICADEDQAVIQDIANALTARGLSVWPDQRDFSRKSHLKQSIDGLAHVESAVVFAFFGRDGIGPCNVAEATEYLSQLVNRKCSVVPVLLPGVFISRSLPDFLSGFISPFVDGITEDGISTLERLATCPTVAAQGAQPGASTRAASQGESDFLELLEQTLESDRRATRHERFFMPEARLKEAILLDSEKSVRRVNEVYLGAATPRVVATGSQFVARFAAYSVLFREHVRAVMAKESPKSEVLLDLDVCQWKVGTEVIVHLAALGLNVVASPREFRWNGKCEVIRFDIEVPKNLEERQLALKFDIAVAGVVIATLRPEVEIRRHVDPGETTSGVQEEIRAPKTAFASYAAKNRRAVLARLRSLQILTGIDVFVDCLSIHPGEKWKSKLMAEIVERDVFLLFWSRPAMKSKWVDWEWRYALEKKSINRIQPHPLQPADLAPPPQELAELQFGSAYEYYVAALESSWMRSFLKRVTQGLRRIVAVRTPGS